MTGSRISDMTPLTTLPAGAAVPVIYGGANYQFDLGTGLLPTEAGLFGALASQTIVADSVQSTGYSSVGKGRAWYIYDVAVNAAYVAANPRTSFVSANGRGYRLDPQQRLTIQMFGGLGDAVVSLGAMTSGTDNYAAIMAATAFYESASFKFVPTVYFPVGRYYVSDTIEPRAVIHFKGETSGQDESAVTGFAASLLYWPNTKTCIRLPESNTAGTGAGSGGSAAGSIVEGLTIAHLSQGADLTKHGIHARTRPTLRDLVFLTISGNGIHIEATAGAGGSMEGNANNWRVETCLVHSCGGHGLYVHGNDANAGSVFGFETKSCGGCGALDLSGLGNNYFGLNIAGFGDGGVTYSGRHYQLIAAQGDSSLGATTTPGTNNTIWYDLGSGSVASNFPTWVSGTTYGYKMPIAAFGSSNSSIFAGMYVEGTEVLSHLESPAVALSGQTKFTRYTAHFFANNGTSPLFSNTGVAGRHDYPAGSTEATNHGSYIQALVGTPNSDSTGGLNVFEHWRQKDGDIAWQYGYRGTDLAYYFLNQKDVWRVTTPSSAVTFGRSAPVPYIFTLPDFAMVDPGNSNNARIHGLTDAAPTSGNHAQGEVRWNVAPTAGGKVGWVCTASGTPGTWKPFGAIDA